MHSNDHETERMVPPWRRNRPKRTPKQRLRLVLASLIGLYVLNVAANGLYKSASQAQIDLLRDRAVSLARLDRDDPEIARIEHLIDIADYASLVEVAPRAIAKRQAAETYLRQHPHVSVGVAVDGKAYTRDAITGMLNDLNRRLRPHRLSIGLAEPAVDIEIPTQATREDFLLGITSAFQRRPDYVIALTTKRCGYTAATSRPGEPARNRVYTFGWMGMSVVDGAVIDANLNTRLGAELSSFLRRDTRERRWRAADYTQRAETILAGHQIIGRWAPAALRERNPTDDTRSITVSIGLDGVAPAQAETAIQDANAIFRPLGVSFVIRHLHPHALKELWKWPVEMQKMLRRGNSDLYILLSSSEWASPDRGLVRGLANATVGAMMIQTGSRDETARRMAHELGHMFGLPHTLLNGYVMYPNESRIGLKWSPGNKKLLARNRQSARWYSSIASPVRFDIAIRLAPVMRRVTATRRVMQAQEAFAAGDVWVSCGTG